jgi:hypothetical protein
MSAFSMCQCNVTCWLLSPAPVMRVRLSSGIDWATFNERLMAIWPLKHLLCRLSGVVIPSFASPRGWIPPRSLFSAVPHQDMTSSKPNFSFIEVKCFKTCKCNCRLNQSPVIQYWYVRGRVSKQVTNGSKTVVIDFVLVSNIKGGT